MTKTVSLLPSVKRYVTGLVFRRRLGEKRYKRRAAEQGLSKFSTKDGVVSELTIASSNLILGQSVCSGSVKPKTDIRLVLSRDAEDRYTVTAAATTLKTRPRCF